VEEERHNVKLKEWEQKPDESAQAYFAFTCYRDLPALERTLDKAFEESLRRRHGGRQEGDNRKAGGNWRDWMAGNKWVERARAYDAHIERETAQRLEAERIRQVADMRRRHSATGRALFEQGVRAFRSRVEKVQTEGKDIPDWLWLQLVREGTKMEAEALGEPSVIQGTVSPTGTAIGDGENELSEQDILLYAEYIQRRQQGEA
jgi:hypothetical protein